MVCTMYNMYNSTKLVKNYFLKVLQTKKKMHSTSISNTYTYILTKIIFSSICKNSKTNVRLIVKSLPLLLIKTFYNNNNGMSLTKKPFLEKNSRKNKNNFVFNIS